MVKKFDKTQLIQTANRCLIIAPSWVGDMVMAQSLFIELKKIAPALNIDVLAPSWCGALTQFMPEVDQIIDAPFEHGKLGMGARRRLGKSLRGKYDIAFVLPNSLKAALVPWFAKIPTRVGYIGEQRYMLLNAYHPLDKTALPTMCQRFVALALLLGEGSENSHENVPSLKEVPAPKFVVSKADAIDIMSKYELSIEGRRVVALFPGAEFGSAKQWPADHYATIARYYIDNGFDVWLFGSLKDAETCEKINSKTQNRCANLAGKTTLVEATQLISLIELAISNDSGLMHIAAALNKPLVSIYGSTDPNFTPPMHGLSQVVRLNLSCSPCFKRECPLGHLDCLTKLRPQQVLEAAQRLI